MKDTFNLRFSEVSAINLARCSHWHPNGLMEWSSLEWAGAMCGEAGEAANVAKKIKRLETGIERTDRGSMATQLIKAAEEIGGTFMYLDLLAQRLGLSIADCVAYEFNRVSERERLPQTLDYDYQHGLGDAVGSAVKF